MNSSHQRGQGVAILERSAYWIVQHPGRIGGAALLIVALLWSRFNIAGPWSSSHREALYLADLLLLYMLVAIGLNVLSGFAGPPSIGHIALYGIGAYTVAILTTRYGWNYWPAILAGAIIAAVVALPVGLLLLRLAGWYFAVVTLLLIVVVNDLWIQQASLTGGGAGIFGIRMPSIGDHTLNMKDYFYLLLLVNVVSFLLIRQLVTGSRWGRAMVAVRDADLAARAVGIHPFMVQECALAISAFLTGLAGGMFAPLPGLITPDSFPLMDSIFFLLAVLAGGLGTIEGPVVGMLVLFSLPQVLARQRGLRDYSSIAYAVLLLALVIFLPEGIVGGVQRIWNRLLGEQFIALGKKKLINSHMTILADHTNVHHYQSTIFDSIRINLTSTTALRYLQHKKCKPSGYILEAVGITKLFGGVAALEDVTINVRASTVHALIGPNGSGKTTLLNIISGFYKPERGTVRILNQPYALGHSSRAIRYGIARTFQLPQIVPTLTVEENVMLGCHPAGHVTWLEGMLPLPRSRKEQQTFRERARECLDLVGFGQQIAHLPCGRLPFAHQRLVEFARAVAGEPYLLLLDEPASGLHPEEIHHFIELVRTLRNHGLTIILVEHNLKLVADLADIITVLDAGRVIAQGTYDVVCSNPAVIEAYLGS